MKARILLMKCRNPLIYIPIFMCVILLYVLNLQLDSYPLKMKTNIRINTNNGFLIKTSGCRIPYLDPFDESIVKYIYKVDPINCNQPAPLVQSDLNSIFIDQQQLIKYNITNLTMVECCYQPFWRKNTNQEVSDNLYVYGNCTNFYLNAKIEEEYIKVMCKVNETDVYKDFHSFVPIKKNKFARQSKHNLNVLIVGLDSISRLNFHRQLPSTKKFISDELNGIDISGYNKVADNTFPNLMPILTGQTVEELQGSCWPTTNTKFDDCDFIWKNFTKKGYLTALAEDSSWMGIFNYLKKGFRKQPTDYYWRTFNYLAEKEIGHLKTYNADLCIGPKPTYIVLLEYIKKFITSLQNEMFFGLFWGTSLSHDNINYPGQGDKDYELFFRFYKESNIFNKTVLIVLSDHGMRWGDIRSTHQGHLEERLPFLYFIFPPWFNKTYPTALINLKRNAKRLTSPFDLHETLKDLLNIEVITNDNIAQRSKTGNNARGISLFTPIPENRTCFSANISSHWCTCQKTVEVEINNTLIQKASEFIIAHINKLLNGYRDCVYLQLHEIMDARLSVSADYLKNNEPIQDYTIILKTKPGGGLFEATVRCVHCNSENDFELTGTISRLNLYGRQSACITDYHLKLYCYCAR